MPGVSAGIGGLAYAGIPVTHRDVNHAVTFLTGHDQSGLTPSSIDWEGLARGAPVIVMYMAMKHLGQIAASLIKAGRQTSEPVAIVCNATTEAQQVLETTLGAAAADLEKSGLQPPAVVVVGEVVRMRAGLDWLGALVRTRARRRSARAWREVGEDRHRMTKGLIVAAAASHSGKTTVALGLIAALRGRGLKVAAAKCGPDYIDPKFLEAGERQSAGDQSRSLGDGAGAIRARLLRGGRRARTSSSSKA